MTATRTATHGTEESDLPDQPYVFRREGILQFRRRVPDDVRPLFGNRLEWTRSLRKFSHADALRVVREMAVDTDRQIAMARSSLAKEAAQSGRVRGGSEVNLSRLPTGEEIDYIASAVLSSILAADREGRTEGLTRDGSRSEADRAIREAIATGDPDPALMLPFEDWLLNNGLLVPQDGTAEYRKLIYRFTEGVAKAYRLTAQRDQGEPVCPASTIPAGGRQLSWPVSARIIFVVSLGLSPSRGMPRLLSLIHI